jgi:hypothetical protein
MHSRERKNWFQPNGRQEHVSLALAIADSHLAMPCMATVLFLAGHLDELRLRSRTSYGVAGRAAK